MNQPTKSPRDDQVPGAVEGTITEVWRYPVKSMQGELLRSVEVDATGIDGDRRWAVLDRGTGRVLSARKTPELLAAAAQLRSDGQPILTLPNGTELIGTGDATDDALADWLGVPAHLASEKEAGGGSVDFIVDATDDTSEVVQYTTPPGRFVDVFPLLLLTTASLREGQRHYPTGDWDRRRFRPNVLIDVDGDGWIEDMWCNRDVALGGATVSVERPCDRCTIVTRAQPGLQRDVEIFKALAKHHASFLGVWCAVARPGTISVGDQVMPT
jgi:uncharacterized protein YcbX